MERSGRIFVGLRIRTSAHCINIFLLAATAGPLAIAMIEQTRALQRSRDLTTRPKRVITSMFLLEIMARKILFTDETPVPISSPHG